MERRRADVAPMEIASIDPSLVDLREKHRNVPTSQLSFPDETANTGDHAMINVLLAGGIGGAIADSAIYPLDTVKTRQQGAPGVEKYRTMGSAWNNILRQEGLRKGVYGGYAPAIVGAVPATMLFFGTYEFTKRQMIGGWGVPETITHLTAGFIGDLASSFVYVPSEVLKTRLQLQGRFNNPHFDSGYNYRGTTDAIRTIVRTEGAGALFYGYKATLIRDLPFSALQFAFYEKFHQWAQNFVGKDQDMGVGLELVTGAVAGGLAGVITTPLDVIKTRVQTQHNDGTHQIANSTMSGLRSVYRTQGIGGVFGGVGPRLFWTSIQSSIMLLVYQTSLKLLGEQVLDTPAF